MAPGSFASLLSLIRLRELDGAGSLRPVAGAVLHQLFELNCGVIYTNDDTEVLPHIIADLDLIDVFFGRAHERKSVLAALQGADHRQRFQWEGFQRLLAPIEIRRKLARTLQRLDLARAKRIGKIECVIGEGLVRLDLRKRIELALYALALFLHPGFQVLVLSAASSDGHDHHETHGETRNKT